MKKLLSTLFFFICMVSFSMESRCLPEEEILKVGVFHSPPFAIHDPATNIWQGLGVDLFKAIAEHLGLSYRFMEIHDAIDIKALANTYDLIIGNFSYSQKNSEYFQLSLPYYTSGYSILSRNYDNGNMILKTIFYNLCSFQFLYSLMIVFGGMVLISMSLWLMERRVNKQFPSQIGAGLFNGLWWTILTCGGVGGELYPITRRGRTFAMCCVCLSIVGLSHVVAVITALLTKQHLDNHIGDFNDLKKMTIGAVVDEENHLGDFLTTHYFNYRPVKSLDKATSLLKAQEIDVILASSPMMGYYLKQHPQVGLKLSPMTIGKNYYGFLMNPHNKDIGRINSGILKITNEQIWRDLSFKYLNEDFR